MKESGLTLANATPIALILGLLFLGVMSYLSFLAIKRSGFSPRVRNLELLRLLLAILATVTLWQPEWIQILQPDQDPEVVVLYDDSGSMTSKDVIMDTEGEDKVISRKDWVTAQLENEELWKAIKEKYAVKQVAFSSPLTEEQKKKNPGALEGTNLSNPLHEVISAKDNLVAVFLLSDGAWNLGGPQNLGGVPTEAATKMRARGVSLFSIGVGSEERLPDIELTDVTSPKFVTVGEPVRIPFIVTNTLKEDIRTTVELSNEKGTKKVTKEITIPALSQLQGGIFWIAQKKGGSVLNLRVPLQEGELLKENNEKKFQITARKDVINVLIVDTYPRWEYRYLRNALSRDPSVNVSCMLFHPEIGMGEGPDYIQKFPSSIEEIQKYDVIFLGDIGIGPKQLTKKQAELIKGVVEQHASGVVFMPGSQGYQMTLIDSPLGELIPVLLDETKKKGVLAAHPSRIILTPEGKGSHLTMLADSEEENFDVWRHLPGFYWNAPVLKAKRGAQRLAVHENGRNNFGRIPLVVTRPAGYGKVLFMGTDGAWRWRRGVEDKYHYRFWGQVARWMSYQRHFMTGKSDRLRMYYSPEKPEPGELVSITANALDRFGAPLENGEVSVEITTPNGRSQLFELAQSEGGWGTFHGTFKVDRPGSYTIKATSPQSGDVAESEFIVEAKEIEKVGEPARYDYLRELARITKGEMGTPAQLGSFVEKISQLPEPEPLEKRIRIWCHMVWAGLLVLLLGIFWIGRKLIGMV